jgi:hypothetical protein
MKIRKYLYCIFKDIDFIEKQQLKLDANYPSVDFRRYQNDEVCRNFFKIINYSFFFMYSLRLLFINQLILFEIFYYMEFLNLL